MKLVKFLLSTSILFAGVLGVNVAYAEDSNISTNSNISNDRPLFGNSKQNVERDPESQTAAAFMKPIVSAYISGGTLKFGVFGTGPTHNNASTVSARVKDSSGWSAAVDLTSNPCGTDMKEFVSPKTLNGEFTVQILQAVNGTIYRTNYMGVAGNNSVTYGKWTVTGTGLVGVIQNQIGNSYQADDPSITYDVNDVSVEAITVFAKLNSGISVKNAYGATMYGSALTYELYKDCDYDTRASTTTAGYLSNFTAKEVNYISNYVDSSTPGANLSAEFGNTNLTAGAVDICFNVVNDGDTATTRDGVVDLTLNYGDDVYFGTAQTKRFTISAGLQANAKATYCYKTTLAAGTYKAAVFVDKYNDIYEYGDSNITTYIIASNITVSPPVTPSAHVKVYRFYNSKTKAHFFTKNAAERDILINTNPEWSYEAVAYYVINTNSSGNCNGTGGKPVYRFYGTPETGGNSTHFFTINGAEADAIKANDPKWRYEGISWCAQTSKLSGTTEVYRFGNILSNSHFYTINKAESDATKNNPEWRFEGVDYYTYTK